MQELQKKWRMKLESFHGVTSEPATARVMAGLHRERSGSSLFFNRV